MTEQPSYTVIGTPFSTFTRTITLGLQYKGLSYTQLPTRPQKPLASENHPFGYIPTLIIHQVDGKKEDLKLRESQAIIRYIDRVAPEPSLHVQDGDDNIIPEKMWEFASLVACFGFPIVEGGVVKPYIKALDEGSLSPEEIREQLKGGVDELKHFLTVIESLINPNPALFAFGNKPTWADFYLYPLLADLRAIPEWEVVGPRIVDWMNKMDELDTVKATAAGTLSAGARPGETFVYGGVDPTMKAICHSDTSTSATRDGGHVNLFRFLFEYIRE